MADGSNRVEQQQRELQQFREEALGLKIHISNAREGNNIQVKDGQPVTPHIIITQIPHQTDPNAMDVDQMRARGGNRNMSTIVERGPLQAQCPEPRKAQRAPKHRVVVRRKRRIHQSSVWRDAQKGINEKDCCWTMDSRVLQWTGSRCLCTIQKNRFQYSK